MEIGAVKHALNSEIISLKAGMNQARTQTINKLTRKSKVFKMRKGPDKEKFIRKAEACLSEVFIMKKIKAKELMRFAITCDKNLQKYINQPEVNQEKAMARLLLHKSIEDRTSFLKKKFGDMPIDELMMTRRERLKIKKEKKEKDKREQERKNSKNKPIEGDDVGSEADDVGSEEDSVGSEEGDFGSDESDENGEEDEGSEHDNGDDVEISEDEQSVHCDGNKKEGMESDEDVKHKSDFTSGNDERESLESSDSELLGNENFSSGLDNENSNPHLNQNNNINTPVTKSSPTKKSKKSTAKAKKNVKAQVKKKGKLQKQNQQVQKTECAIDAEQKAEGTIVDSFFITSTGSNYKTLSEPRLPDDLGKVDLSGNRQMRRAAAFGRTYKPKFSKNSKDHQPFTGRKDRFLHSKADRSEKFNKVLPNRKEGKNHYEKSSGSKHMTNGGSRFSEKPILLDKGKSAPIETKNEKLHPSWEAKKKASGIQAFQGKKVVFDND